MQASGSRWSLLPEPANPLPWRRDAWVRQRVAVYLMGAGDNGATAAQLADALDIAPRQVRMACYALQQERRVIVARTIPSAGRPQGGGRGRCVYVLVQPECRRRIASVLDRVRPQLRLGWGTPERNLRQSVDMGSHPSVSLRLGQSNPGENRITIDGHEMASMVNRVELVSEAGNVPRLVLHGFSTGPIAAHLRARVEITLVDRVALERALEDAYRAGRRDVERGLPELTGARRIELESLADRVVSEARPQP
jgi:hypothetical protein